MDRSLWRNFPIELHHGPTQAVAGERLARFWFDPVELASSRRMRAGEIRVLGKLVEQHRDTLLEAWHAYFDT